MATRIQIDDSQVPDEFKRFYRHGYVTAFLRGGVDDDRPAWEETERAAYDKGCAAGTAAADEADAKEREAEARRKAAAQLGTKTLARIAANVLAKN